MTIRKKNKDADVKRLTPMQTHDVWEVTEVEEITEEVTQVFRKMGLDTEEVEKAYSGSRPEKKEGS
jgi:hypothetical protein